MKKFYVLALSALMVAAFAVPSMAKVNLSGAIWATYWAQQQGNALMVNGGEMVNGALVPERGNSATASPKTFLVAQSMSGNGVSAKAAAGDGFLLALDCPVNDWVKAYGEFDVMSTAGAGANAFLMQQAYINLAFMKELNIRVGRMVVPFGYEQSVRPTVGQEEVFVSNYSQSANGVLQRRYDVGVQALGTLASGMIDYNVYMMNGAPSTVADSRGAVAASQVTPDIDDAKQIGVNLCFKPFTGAFIGGGYLAGDFTNGYASGNRSKATAYDVNAGYSYANIFSVSGEYARTRHDRISAAYPYGLVAPAATALAQNKVNEYILKAIYTGVADWEFGVRYGAIDPANVEAEVAAGYSFERKISFAAGYKFARAAFLKAEYSWINSKYDFTNAIAGAPTNRQNPTQDVDDDILALSLGLQF